MEKLEELKKKRKKLRNSFKYAFEGVHRELKEEQNLKIHLLIMVCVIIAGLIQQLN